MTSAAVRRRGFARFVTILLALVMVSGAVRALASRHHHHPVVAATTPAVRHRPANVRLPTTVPVFHRVPAVPPAAQAEAVRRLIRLGYPVRCGGTTRPFVALTFDDGPGPLTEATLTFLKQARVPATFFLVGKELAGWPQLAAVPREERAQGAVGDHTWNHVSLVGKTRAQLDEEVLRTKTAVARASGGAVTLFRPPYGAHDAALDGYLRSVGLLEVLWSVDPLDSRAGVTPNQILAGVSSGLRPGAIVLLHENRSTTLRVIPAVLRLIRARGFTPLTVPELMVKDPPTLSQLKTGRCP